MNAEYKIQILKRQVCESNNKCFGYILTLEKRFWTDYPDEVEFYARVLMCDFAHPENDKSLELREIFNTYAEANDKFLEWVRMSLDNSAHFYQFNNDYPAWANARLTEEGLR